MHWLNLSICTYWGAFGVCGIWGGKGEVHPGIYICMYVCMGYKYTVYICDTLEARNIRKE